VKLVDISGTKRRSIYKLKLILLKLTVNRDTHRGINGGYQHKTNVVKDEKDDLVTDFHCIFG